MHTAIEINRPLVAALRTSEALPNTHEPENGDGKLFLLYAEQYHPVGYLVEKTTLVDKWESPDPRSFITTSHAEALELMAIPFGELPSREVAMG